MSPVPESLPPCPKCDARYTYELGVLLVCAMCAHEWSADDEPGESAAETEAVIVDAVGNPLADGDTVTVIKSVRVAGGGGGTIKIGTKVRGIRLLDRPVDGHDIDARVPGFGPMKLKSSVVKKA